MTKAEIIKAICETSDYRFTHDEMIRMSKKELLEYYPEYKEDLKDLVHYLSYKKGYFDGRIDEKGQMLKEAVEGEIQMRYSGCLCAKTIRAINEDKFKFGDKVKIIIVKEDEK